MNKIVPKIFNGDLQLILSETFCCDPTRGVRIHIPVTMEKDTVFSFVFKSDSDRSNRSIQTNQEGNTLTFFVTNFLNTFGASLTNFFEFKIGPDQFFLQIYGTSTSEIALCLTVSIFKGVQ